MTLVKEINRSISTPFRRAYIRRRSNTTGLYETDWYEITDYVISWGKLHSSVDEVRLNAFKHSGITLQCKNDEGAFNPEYNSNSLWNGYMTRYRTLLKIEAGYYEDGDVNGTQYPTVSSQGIFILTDDIVIDGDKNRATLKFRSLMSVFDEVKAKDVSGLGTKTIASSIITKIRDHTDGSGHFVFQQFISSSAWDITSGSTRYNLATTTSIEDKSCWELMQELAEAEGYIMLINRSGGFEFRDRTTRNAASQFTFNGQGFKDTNIIKLSSYKEPISKFFNYIRLKFLEEDTNTSYVTAGTTATVDPSATAWKYGTRTFEFENDFLSTTSQAKSVVDNLLTKFGTIQEEVTIDTKFCPQLEVSDRVTFNYRSYNINSVEGSYYDSCNYGEISTLVLHLSMNDNLATPEVKDISSFGHNGEFTDTTGSPNTEDHSVDGQVASALQFDGVDDLVVIDNTSTLDLGYSNFSFAFWEKRDSLGTYVILAKDTFDFQSPAGQYRWILDTENNKFNFRFDGTTLSSNTEVNDLGWHFVVFVRRGNNSEWYIDGTGEATASSFISATSFSNDKQLMIGGQAATLFYHGRLDNIFMYKQALSLSQVAYMWNNGIGRVDGADENVTPIGYYDEEAGENFDWDGIKFKILSKHHDLMKLKSKFLLRKL